ncbi:MAG: response regulator [Clostridia bacterium]|nr:response regulator [Clostridia bacterium]
MYYSIIGILGILLLFLVNRDILLGRNASLKKPAWKVYRRFLFTVLVYYVTDVIWGILEALKLSALLFADTTVYFVVMAAGVLYWAVYTITYLEDKTTFGQGLMIAGSVLSAGIFILAIFNIFMPLLFTVDANSVYTALPLRYVSLGCQILLLIVISAYALVSVFRLPRNAPERQRYTILSAFGLIMAVFLFAQLWFPYLPLYTIAYILATCMLHSFVINEEREEYQRNQEETKKVTELKNTITSLLDNMPGMTFTKEAKTGVYLACNQAFAEYAHKENPEGVLGLTDAQIFDAETAAHFVAADKMAQSLSKPYVFFEDVPDAAGNQRQLQTTKLSYKDAMGRLCVLGMCQDVTDMVRIQHENAMTKEAYESAVSSGLMYTHIAQTLARDYTDMYYVNTDTEEYIRYCRNTGESTLSEAQRGWHFFSDCISEMSEKVFPEDRDSFRQAMTRKTLMKALDLKSTFVMTYRETNDKHPVYVSMKVSRMEDDEHYIIVGITNIDAEMRDAMAKSEALAEALAAAEQANRARSSFLSNMSHEIRTPMSAIIGLDTLALKKEGLDSQTREYLEKIGGNARHLLNVINGILDLSHIESGHIALREEPFSLRSLLEQINARFAERCDSKGLTYECSIPDRITDRLLGDEMKLGAILDNLLSNAVKFTEAPGSVMLSVEQTAEFEDQATIRFRIRDTGIGMDPAFLPKAFEAFAQEDSSFRTRFGGTGLGMTITKMMVEIMNGSISISSEKNAGTEVTVTVTLKADRGNGGNRGENVDLGALYVLVVDDDPIDVEHAREILEEAGIRADSCTSGQEALRMMDVQHRRHKPYNLVLMDWNMPGMNGLETSAEIRKQFRDETAIAVLTAYDWDDIREEADRVGVIGYLMKPLLAANIREEITRIARRSNMAVFSEKKRANLAGRRILLAEDLDSNAEIMTDILELENIEAVRAENGRIAVEKFADSAPGTYAAILMDVRMPEMDGLEATETIRAMNRKDAKRIPIVALTANAFDEDVQRSLQAGMNAHLSKPVDSDHLIRVLGELVYQAERIMNIKTQEKSGS